MGTEKSGERYWNEEITIISYTTNRSKISLTHELKKKECKLNIKRKLCFRHYYY